MRDAEPRTIHLADYQPPAYRTRSVQLHFDIRDGETRVVSTLEVVRERPGALELDGQDLELVSLKVDGELLSSNAYERTDTGLTVLDVGDAATIEIVTRIRPEQNTALEGLYKSSHMYCTQCEAEGFRNITYYQDRPDVLARFTTTVEADAKSYPVLLSNGNCVAESVRDGRKSVTWEDPFPKPAYLFALVAGDLAHIEDRFTTRSGREVTLRIYSEPHNIGQCDYAMDALKRSMRWDEEVFGREYDLDIFMIVAVEDFNMGAMENKGLNIFNTSCVLASPDTATDLAYQRVEAVVAHEYFHNWSGNRVTCRDWFQLSLKEGFTVFRDAEFSSDMHSRTVKRIDDVKFLRAVQFAEDGGPLAHPVRPDSYIEISNFYTVTIYEKGAEVVRMYHTLLGAEAFRRGSDLYFERHDGEAATTDDFLACMQAVTDLDLSQFQRWYEQAGTPVVALEQSFSGDTLTLTFRQSCPPTPGQANKAPLLIPFAIGLIGSDGAPLPLDGVHSDVSGEVRGDTLVVHLRDEETSVRISGLAEQPVVSALRGFSAPVRLQMARSAEEQAFLARHDTDGFARWDALQALLVAEIEQLMSGGTVRPLVLDVFRALAKQAQAADDAEQAALLATMLVLPDEAYLFEQIAPVDVDAICDARDTLERHLADALAEDWRTLYDVKGSEQAFEPAPTQMARRALRHTALRFLVAGATVAGDLERLLGAHLDRADNLTERRTAFELIAASPLVSQDFRRTRAQQFYERYADEALVVDAWFSAQAMSPVTSVTNIQELARHSAFDARNPNKLRALYGVFAARNFRRFHALDGSGYDFLADRVIELNAQNPQIASRLTTELTRFRRYDAARQVLMRKALERIAAEEDLSKDVFEVVTKSLA